MSLPKITKVSKIVHLPIDDRDVRIYAFSIGEEKILVLNKDENEKVLEDNIIELVKNKTPDVNIDQLTIVDIIVLFVNIMDISKGTSEDLRYKCLAKDENGKTCDTIIDITVNLTDYIINGESKNHKLINITDDISCELKYPSYAVINSLEKYKNDENEYLLRLYSKCIESVYQGNNVTSEFNDDEIYEWLLDLPSNTINIFNDFMNDIPTLSLEYDVICPKCGSTHHYKIDNLLDFFMQNSQV